MYKSSRIFHSPENFHLYPNFFSLRILLRYTIRFFLGHSCFLASVFYTHTKPERCILLTPPYLFFSITVTILRFGFKVCTLIIFKFFFIFLAFNSDLFPVIIYGSPFRVTNHDIFSECLFRT